MLALNAAFEAETSTLDRARLTRWVNSAYLALAVNHGHDGFVITLDQDCAVYDSPNFRWFTARLARFVYIDRIIVAPHAQRSGLGRELYRMVIQRMARTGHDTLACEVNLDPPNPRSERFHASLGFTRLGDGAPYGDQRRVAYMVRKEAVLF